MSWSPSADKEEIEYQSGLFGREYRFFDSKASQLGYNTTGNAIALNNEDGLILSAESNTGDKVSIEGLHTDGFSDGYDKTFFEILMTPRVTTPWTDDCEVGLMGFDINSDNGTYLDFTTEEINLEGTKRALDSSLPSDEPVLLHIEVDYENNETVVELSGSVEQTEKFSQASTYGRLFAQVVSNGGSENLHLNWMRVSHLPMKL